MQETLDPVHHIAIQANDLRKTLKWYQDRFAVKVLYEDNSWALLQFRNIKLALVSPDQHPAHLAFEHPEAGACGDLNRHRDGSYSVYINDPDGNAVELMLPADTVAR